MEADDKDASYRKGREKNGGRLPDFIPTNPGIPAYSDRRVFLDHPMMDNLLKIVLDLGAETWVTRRRLRIVEQLLDAGGVVTRDAVETHIMSPDEEAELKRERTLFIQRVYGVLARDTVAE